MAIRFECILQEPNREAWQLHRLPGPVVSCWNLEPLCRPGRYLTRKIIRLLTLRLGSSTGSTTTTISRRFPIPLPGLVGGATLCIGFGFHVRKRVRDSRLSVPRVWCR